MKKSFFFPIGVALAIFSIAAGSTLYVGRFAGDGSGLTNVPSGNLLAGTNAWTGQNLFFDGPNLLWGLSSIQGTNNATLIPFTNGWEFFPGNEAGLHGLLGRVGIDTWPVPTFPPGPYYGDWTNPSINTVLGRMYLFTGSNGNLTIADAVGSPLVTVTNGSLVASNGFVFTDGSHRILYWDRTHGLQLTNWFTSPYGFETFASTYKAQGTNGVTNIYSSFVNGATTNAGPMVAQSFTGNASGLTNVPSATNAINATNFWGLLSATNLPAGLSTSNYIGTQIGNGSGLTNLNANSLTNQWTGVFPYPDVATVPKTGDTELGGNNHNFNGHYGFALSQLMTNQYPFVITNLRVYVPYNSASTGNTNAMFWLFSTAAASVPNVFTTTPLYSNKMTLSGYGHTGWLTNLALPSLPVISNNMLWVVFANSNASTINGTIWFSDSENLSRPRRAEGGVIVPSGIISHANDNGAYDQSEVQYYGCPGFELDGYYSIPATNLSTALAVAPTNALWMPYSTNLSGLVSPNVQGAIDQVGTNLATLWPLTNNPAVSNMTYIQNSGFAYARCQWGNGSNWIQKLSLTPANNSVANVAVGMIAEYLLPASLPDSSVPGASYGALKFDPDDIAPIDLTQTYIGANHGANYVDAVTATGHGKTAVDVGSIWTDGAVNYTLISIPDVNTVWMLQAFGGSGANWTANHTMSGSSLTHVSGATHTTTITVVSDTARTQMLPCASNDNVLVYLNGNYPVTSDGAYPCQFVDIVNSYTIVDPASVAAYLQANVGSASPSALNNPAIGQLARIVLRYRFTHNGACTVFQTIKWMRSASLAYAGFVQAAAPSPSGTPSSGISLCVPGTTAFTNWYAISNTDLNITTNYYLSLSTPPSRVLEMNHASAAGTNSYGYEVGYAPLALGISTNRAGRTSQAADVYSSEKMYPYALSTSSTNYPSGVVSPGEVWDVVGLRAPLNPYSVSNCLGVAAWWNCGANYYAAIDIQTNYTGPVALPKHLSGRTVVPAENYNVNLQSLVVGDDGVFIQATNGSGYATFWIMP